MEQEVQRIGRLSSGLRQLDLLMYPKIEKLPERLFEFELKCCENKFAHLAAGWKL